MMYLMTFSEDLQIVINSSLYSTLRVCRKLSQQNLISDLLYSVVEHCLCLALGEGAFLSRQKRIQGVSVTERNTKAIITFNRRIYSALNFTYNHYRCFSQVEQLKFATYKHFPTDVSIPLKIPFMAIVKNMPLNGDPCGTSFCNSCGACLLYTSRCV